MQGHIFKLILLITGLIVLDLYVLSGIRSFSEKIRFVHKKWFVIIYWLSSFLLFADLLFVVYVKVGFAIRLIFILWFFLVLVFKVSFSIFLLIDDFRRFIIYLKQKKKKTFLQQLAPSNQSNVIPRSAFLLKAGLLAGAIPLAALKLSMKTGLYDYHIKHQILYLPNLPKAFDGIKLGQISDIHSGSFTNKKSVLGGVEMLMREKADIIFFTGDLVNSLTAEMYSYQDIFSKVKAPLGVYSSLGNHDYGDYAEWQSIADKDKNLQDLITTHKNMGWNLLMNQNHRLKVDGEEIGILGVENWGELNRFLRRGRMDMTVKNTDDLPVKLLLSHDPSHWRAQILPEYPQIDVMFSGHTHGMQLGVQIKNFQWSPIEYIYNEWAGFYHQGKQQLYVNVGYGFIEIAGRVGILPEITIFELKAATNPLLKNV